MCNAIIQALACKGRYRQTPTQPRLPIRSWSSRGVSLRFVRMDPEGGIELACTRVISWDTANADRYGSVTLLLFSRASRGQNRPRGGRPAEKNQPTYQLESLVSPSHTSISHTANCDPDRTWRGTVPPGKNMRPCSLQIRHSAEVTRLGSVERLTPSSTI